MMAVINEVPTYMRRAFTLIELLVVIAIIAILAAILFPVFAQAKAAAKKTVSLSNTKQLSLAQLMYCNDNDDVFPSSWLKGFPGDFNFWTQPYIKSLDILENPDKPISPAALAGPCANDGYGNSWQFSPGGRDNPTNLPELWGYGFNTGYTYCNNKGLTIETPNNVNGNATYPVQIGGVTINAVIRPTVHAGVSTSAVSSAASVIMLGSTNGLPLMSVDIDNLRPLGVPTIHYTGCELASRNTGGVDNGGYCMAYVDGHSKWLKFNPTLAANVYTYNGAGDSLTTLSIPDPCQLEASYDGGSDTPEQCKEGFPNG